MDELSKGLSISVSAPLRDKALGMFLQQIKEWGIALPDVEPLVLDFGLDDFHKVGLIEYWIANEVDAGYCGKYLFVFDGQSCPRHRHQHKKETFFLVKGQLQVEYDGQVLTMQPGDVLVVDPLKYHSFTGIGPALILELSMPCIIDDNHFSHTLIPIGANYKGVAG
jgi:N-acetylneuraminate synthase